MSGKSDENRELYDRIRPLMDSVDLNNIDPRASAALYTSELGGLPTTDEERRILHLAVTGIITSEEGRKMGCMVLR